MSPFAISLPQFEGPLEWLLDKVRQEQVDIARLPLAPIAAQYLAYIEQAEALDVNLGIEWADMAARLIRWKSASLLPADPALPPPEQALAEELRRELERLDKEQLARAKEFLADRRDEEEHKFTHTARDGFRDPLPPPDLEEFASLWTLRKKAQTLRGVFLRRREDPQPPYELGTDTVSVGELIEWIRQRLLEVEPGTSVAAERLFAEVDSLPRKICLFLGLLELARINELGLEASADQTRFFCYRLA